MNFLKWIDWTLGHFNSISVISVRLAGDNERLCAMEHRLQISTDFLYVFNWRTKSFEKGTAYWRADKSCM